MRLDVVSRRHRPVTHPACGHNALTYSCRVDEIVFTS